MTHDPVRDALRALVECWHQFKSHAGWGNQEQAYYDLAKHAQKEWAAAEAALKETEDRAEDYRDDIGDGDVGSAGR